MDSSPNVLLTWYLIHGFQQPGGKGGRGIFFKYQGTRVGEKGADCNTEQKERSNSAGTKKV